MPERNCIPLGSAKAFRARHSNNNHTIINCGLGTTGTTFLFKQACALGMTAAHNGATCNTKVHEQVMIAKEMWDIYNDIQKCSSIGTDVPVPHSKNASTRFWDLCRTDEISYRLESNLRKALRWPFDLVTDTPWANECLYFAKHLTGSLLVQTSRDHHIWAHRRVAAHQGRGLSCRFPTDASPFELRPCLFKSGKPYAQEIFILHGDLVRKQGLQELGHRFLRHNDMTNFQASREGLLMRKFCSV
jgi:hypothetical protein